VLPDGVLRESDGVAEFLPGDDSPKLSAVSRELGPTTLRAPDVVDLLARMWVCELVAPNVILYPESNPLSSETLFAAPAGAKTVSLAFSQTGWPHVVVGGDGGAWLWWYDTLAQQYATLVLPDLATPILTMDDKRRDASLSNRNDIIFFYIAEPGLCYRLQRQRFATEHVAAHDVGGAIVRAGMAADWRLYVEIE
jgi:hypothetical protein